MQHLFGETGGEQHLDPRELFLDPFRELGAVHAAGHDHVGEHEINLRVCLDLFQRLAPFTRLEYAVAEVVEHVRDRLAYAGVVFHHEDEFASARDSGMRRIPAGCLLDRVVVEREIELDAGPDILFAVEVHVPSALLGETVDHAQSEPRPLADLLGGEERLEGVGGGFRGHADAGVADRELRVTPGGHVRSRRRVVRVEVDEGRLDDQFASIRHRVARIDDQVEQDVLQPQRVQPHGNGAVVELEADPDVLGNRAPEHFRHAANRLVEVHGLVLEHLAS